MRLGSIFLIVGTVIGLSAAHAQPRPSGVSSFGLSEHRREVVDVRGAVRSVSPSDGGFLIEIDVGSAPEHAFRVGATRRRDIPLAIGQVIDAHVDCISPGWHDVCSGVVLDDAGALLFAVAASGEEALAPGWRLVGDGPPVRGLGRVEQPLVLEHTSAGQPPTRVSTTGVGWRRVTTSDGAWLVSGSYSHTVYATATEARVPDAVDYRSYAITRAPAPPSP